MKHFLTKTILHSVFQKTFTRKPEKIKLVSTPSADRFRNNGN